MIRATRLFGFTVALFALAVVGLFCITPAQLARAQAIAGQYLKTGQVLVGVTSAAPTTAQLFDNLGNGTILLGAFTDAQLSTLAAPASGYLALNVSRAVPLLVVSTGASANTAGAWILVSSWTTTANTVPVSGHNP